LTQLGSAASTASLTLNKQCQCNIKALSLEATHWRRQAVSFSACWSLVKYLVWVVAPFARLRNFWLETGRGSLSSSGRLGSDPSTPWRTHCDTGGIIAHGVRHRGEVRQVGARTTAGAAGGAVGGILPALKDIKAARWTIWGGVKGRSGESVGAAIGVLSIGKVQSGEVQTRARRWRWHWHYCLPELLLSDLLQAPVVVEAAFESCLLTR
jgi:hypothetical protein